MDVRADKAAIKAAVARLYDIQCKKINTLIRPDGQKKAYVRLTTDYDALDVANKVRRQLLPAACSLASPRCRLCPLAAPPQPCCIRKPAAACVCALVLCCQTCTRKSMSLVFTHRSHRSCVTAADWRDLNSCSWGAAGLHCTAILCMCV